MRRLKHFLAIALMTLAAGKPGAAECGKETLREGDIIFQESLSPQSRAIRLATHSRYSHVGILFDYGRGLEVLEAVQPVSITPLSRFIARGKGGHYVVKRLRGRDRMLTPAVLGKMRAEGRSMIGKRYDVYFEWDDRRIYCTELVWKLYKRAAGVETGRLAEMSSFDLGHPEVMKIMRERFGNSIPMDEPVLSPRSMFESDALETVCAKN